MTPAVATSMARAMDLRMVPPVLLCYICNTGVQRLEQAKKKDARGRPLESRETVSLRGLFGLVMDARSLVEDVEDLRERRLFVGLLHRAELAREARRGRFENLPFRIALLGRIVRAEQVAGHFGDRGKIAGIDLRFIFLGTARPHG